MSQISIKKVSNKKELKTFIRFNYELYKNNPYSVPDLYSDMVNTFTPEKNAALDFCDTELFLAYRDGNVVGRVAAIINRNANNTWNKKEVRFGWIDFIDDEEVSRRLIETVENWGRERGMTSIVGPLGFSDMDAEGMLIEGYDELSTMATIYNYPYYPEHMAKLGFEKDVDWIELSLKVPDAVPDKMVRIARIVEQKYNLHVRHVKNAKEVRESGIGQRMFELINETYAPLYGFSKMTDKQIQHYIKMYLPILDFRMVTFIEDADNNLVAVGVSIPSLSRALQKAKGKLFPFGWFHLLKALFLTKYRSNTLDLLLVGVKTEYQDKGVNAMLFADLIPRYQELGFEYGESNPELEVNTKVQAQWKYFETRQHKRRRCFKKEL
ncbi:MAG: N-acetyltransferase [Bacteroidaceae bacterium]|nr:N-acetyltransferase [Bacteroidaceae bacterium]